MGSGPPVPGTGEENIVATGRASIANRAKEAEVLMSEIKGEQSIEVEAPPDDVFEYVVDFTRHTEWNHQILEVIKDSEGPTGVGTKFRARERPPSKLPLPMKLMFPLMIRMVGIAEYTEAEVTAWEPGRKVAWKASAPLRDGGLWMRSNWQIDLAAENGSTRVTQRWECIPEHDRAKKGMSPDKATKMVAEEVADNISNLKRILEARPATTAS